MVTITVDRLSARLGRQQVLHGISAQLKGGALTGIIGPNGAGKSTLVRAMLGLITPDEGRVTLDGSDLATFTSRELARAIAYLPQGQTLHWPLVVERVVALGRLPYVPPLSRIGPRDQSAIAQAMARADVQHLAHRTATELSGGERARVMLARALAVEARGLIVDEPLASLDPGHQIDVMKLLLREARSGMLVVAVLHDLAEGSPREVLTDTRLREVYGITTQADWTGDAPIVVPLDRWETDIDGGR
jgi:iron complex transport system ATP-binding protein